MRLLYVDDDRINTMLFSETCRLAKGLELETAASGAEALELVGDWQPEVLVIDLHLPDTDGYALLGALRGRLTAPDAPAFLCSADHPDQLRQPALEAGFKACWPKPVDLEAMLADLAETGLWPRP